jgi:uncharacterized protein (UPF0332 family)/predicted nucleotidyltransferase
MAEMIVDDPVLRTVAERLEGLYGDKLVAVLLYGSRARGDHRPDSDYDVAVVVADEATRKRVRADAQDFVTARLRDGHYHDEDVQFWPLTPERLDDRASYLHGLRKDALPIILTPATPEPFRSRRPLRPKADVMQPETTTEWHRAERALTDARRLTTYGDWPIASREAYTAALHAARAVVFESKGALPKTHDGTADLFFLAVRNMRAFNPDVSAILGRGLKLKLIVDYGDRDEVGEEDGRAALDLAERFMAMCQRLLAEIEDSRPTE